MAQKTISNPNGKNGGKDHRDKIKEVESDIVKRKLEPVREKYKQKSDKMEKARYIDIIAENKEGDLLEVHQIGKQNKNGTPVKRERKAMADIEKATGLKVIFHPYNIFILLIVLLISVAFYIS